MRNKDLVEIGVRLEDRTDGPSAIKYDDPETLRAEVAAKAEQEAARAAEKKAKGGSKSVAQRRLELQKQEKVCAFVLQCSGLPFQGHGFMRSGLQSQAHLSSILHCHMLALYNIYQKADWRSRSRHCIRLQLVEKPSGSNWPGNGPRLHLWNMSNNTRSQQNL